MTTVCIPEETNLELYTLIWLDVSSNISIEPTFGRIVNHWKIFDDAVQCEKYIQSLSRDDRVILIIYEEYNRELIKQFHEIPQVYSMYIYCKEKKRNQPWMKRYPKMKGMVSQLNELIDRIHSEQTRAHDPISIHIFNTNTTEESSTTGLNGQFLHFQLLIDVLLRLQSNPTDKNQLISLCKNEYQDNLPELHIIHEFEEHYSSEQAIWWYTRESFLYKMLNKALRTQNIDLLFLFRFFLHDLEKQLQANPSSSSLRVYRSQLMSQNELDLLQNSIGQLISMNSFLSTSFNRDQTLSFLQPSPHLQPILFQIDADPSLEDIKPFSNITRQSYFPDEEEILFMLGSVFRIIRIDFEENKLWVIRMVLCNNELKTIFNYMKKEYGEEEKTSLLSFGKVLWMMGKLQEAEKYFSRLLKELPENHELISYCYRALGNVADDKGDSESCLKWHFKATKLMKKRSNPNDSLLAESYNSIGCVYDTQGDDKQAIEYYKKALNIWKAIYGEDHLNIAICLNNLACVYGEREEYSKALGYYQKVLMIREKHLPRNHSDIGATQNNIGEIYRRLGEYQLALKHFNISKEIYRLSLPMQHPDQAEVLMNIGLVYQNQHDQQQALYYYKKASKIYHQTLPSTHSSVTKIDQLIEHISTS